MQGFKDLRKDFSQRLQQHNNPINDPASRCPVLVLTSQEDEQIARHTWALFPQSRS